MMEVRNEFEAKYEETKKENPGRAGIAILFIFAAKIFSYAVRLVAAAVYLRNCKKGKLVTSRGKPLILVKGKVIIGDRVVFWSIFDRTKLSVRAGGQLIIGDYSRLNGVHIAVKNSVTIGRNVRIAPYTLIMDCDFHDIEELDEQGKDAPIVIHDNVWIASRSIILKGVTIGRGAVVAAGAVVTEDVPPYTVVAGVPAVVIRRLKDPVPA